jgi:hypothetical protein
MIEGKVNFQDKVLTCLDCGQDFIFSSSEQFFFWSKGLAEPKRCKSCRQFRRNTINGKTDGLKEGHDGRNPTS